MERNGGGAEVRVALRILQLEPTRDLCELRRRAFDYCARRETSNAAEKVRAALLTRPSTAARPE